MNAQVRSAEFQRKQACANRLQAIVRQQVVTLREIQALGYNPTPELRVQIDRLIAEYEVAERDLAEAEKVCDEPVFVQPVR